MFLVIPKYTTTTTKDNGAGDSAATSEQIAQLMDALEAERTERIAAEDRENALAEQMEEFEAAVRTLQRPTQKGVDSGTNRLNHSYSSRPRRKRRSRNSTRNLRRRRTSSRSRLKNSRRRWRSSRSKSRCVQRRIPTARKFGCTNISLPLNSKELEELVKKYESGNPPAPKKPVPPKPSNDDDDDDGEHKKDSKQKNKQQQ